MEPSHVNTCFLRCHEVFLSLFCVLRGACACALSLICYADCAGLAFMLLEILPSKSM